MSDLQRTDGRAAADKPTLERRGVPWRYVVVVAGLIVVASVAMMAYQLYPWLRGPDTAADVIAARWAKVEQAISDVDAVLALASQQRRRGRLMGELLRVIAREAVCIVDTLVGTNSTTLLDPPGPAYSDRAAPLFGFVSHSREIALFKDLHGRVHQQATLAQDDHDKLLAVYQQAEVDRPRSLLLDVTWMFSHTVARALTTMAEYETAVPKQP